MTQRFLRADAFREIALSSARSPTTAPEFALLDVREEADFAEAHLLLASNAPLSRLELLIPDLVPRLSTFIVLCDNDEGLALKAYDVLVRHGYDDLAVLDGGIAAAEVAGFVLFSGINVVSKAFGEEVQAVAKTPHIEPAELKGVLDRGDDFVVFDARPPEEYSQMHIPGARSVPGSELVYRLHDLVRGTNTTVVVNCAGRTRSIIGAQSLRNAGIGNPIFALRNGTMGWHLAGFELAHGNATPLPNVSCRAIAAAQTAAERVAQQAGVRAIDTETLVQWRLETAVHNLFIFDIRTREEYESGHLSDARWVQGVQLIQETDRHVGVRNARIVIVDDTGVRATMTASWLLQMGWPQVVTFRMVESSEVLIKGRAPAAPSPLPHTDLGCLIEPDQLHRLWVNGRVVIADLALSREYIKGHIPGATSAIRSRLESVAPILSIAETIVLTSEDGVVAQLAQPELSAVTSRQVLALNGGTSAWDKFGFPLEAGWRDRHPPKDVWIEPYDYESPGEVKQQMQRYLAWEVGLTEQVRIDGSIRFSVFLFPNGPSGCAVP